MNSANRSAMPNSDRARPERQNVATVASLEREQRAKLSAVDRFLQSITWFVGWPPIVMAHAVAFAVWMWVNSGPDAFDPYPFSLLTLAVSLEAILLSCVLLSAQNRMAEAADRRAKLDLQVNLLAEQELTAVLRSLTLIAHHVGLDLAQADPWIKKFQQDTDVRKLDAELDDDGDSGIINR
jgi:uncharacterized membrane protein